MYTRKEGKVLTFHETKDNSSRQVDCKWLRVEWQCFTSKKEKRNHFKVSRVSFCFVSPVTNLNECSTVKRDREKEKEKEESTESINCDAHLKHFTIEFEFNEAILLIL